MAWFLALAMFPMLSYMGHWHLPENLLPAVILGEQARHYHAPATANPHTDGEHDHHEQHCHGSVASCSDIPYGGSATVSLLQMTVADFSLQHTAWAQPGRPVIVPPEPAPLRFRRPPRMAA